MTKKGGPAMPEITEQDLKKQISAGQPAPLYLLWGEEKHLLGRTARRLVRRLGGEDFPAFNRSEFSAEAAMENIADAVLALPFMAERKCVAVSDWNLDEKPQAQLDLLYELLGALPETTSLVLWYPTLDWSEKKSARWKKLLQTANQAGCTLAFARREPGELRRLLAREAEKQGCALPRPSAEKLLEYVGPDLKPLLSELEKLCAFALGGGGGEITPQMVEELTPKSTETTVFLMVNALVAGEYQRAYGLLNALFYQNEDPIAVLGAMASTYVDMYRVRAALESGLTSAAPAEYGDYKNRQFRLRSGERWAKKMTTAQIKRCLDLLLEADLALKGSRLEPRLVLETLVARLLLATEGGRRT